MEHHSTAQRIRLTANVLLALGSGALVTGALFELQALGVIGTTSSWDRPSVIEAFVPVVLGLVLAGLGLYARGRAISVARATPLTFLTADEERQVLDEIALFETRTSGEIRVHLEGHVEGDLLARARQVFEELGMTATAQRNGVLFFVATEDRRFAVLGDSGIDAQVPRGFWDDVVAEVSARFREGAFATGLVRGIDLAGEALAAHFPPRTGDVDELPNTISRGETES